MRNFKNLNTEIAYEAFSMTGFNYDIEIIYNENSSMNVNFDCPKDAQKFEMLYNEVKQAA